MTNERLVPPSRAQREAFLDLAGEYRACGEDRYAEALDDFEGFLVLLAREADPVGLRDGFRAPQTHYWLLDDTGCVLACSRIRHGLTPSLEIEGGNIGYDVRPSERSKGVGTRLLALTLNEARKLGLDRVLVTCDDDNLASVRVIQKNGGREIEASVAEETGQRVRRFWIDLA